MSTGTKPVPAARGRLVRTASLVLVTVAALLVPLVAGTAQAAKAPAVVDRTMSDTRIVESSRSSAAATATACCGPSNDSGGGPVLYAIAARPVRPSATYTVTGASAKDWEAHGRGAQLGQHPLHLHRRHRRQRQEAHRPSPCTASSSRAPSPRPARSRTRRGRSSTPTAPHNAETMLVNPTTLRIYIVTKDPKGGAIYAAPATLSTTATNVLTKVVSDVPVTLSRRCLPRRRPVRPARLRAGLPVQDQAGRDADGFRDAGVRASRSAPASSAGTVFTGEEGRGSKIWRVPLP